MFPVVKSTTNEDVALKNTKYAQSGLFSKRKRIENRISEQEGAAYLSVSAAEMWVIAWIKGERLHNHNKE